MMNREALKIALKLNRNDITDSITASPYFMVGYAFYSLTTGHDFLYTIIWSVAMGLVAGFLITILIRYLILTRYGKRGGAQ